MGETLREKQCRFAAMVGRLLQKAQEMGYEMTLGEVWRTPEQAMFNAKHGRGISNSLHLVRLAIDINLFRVGHYLPQSEDHEPLGRWWESIGGSWGGRFGDGNHYSLEWQGRK